MRPRSLSAVLVCIALFAGCGDDSSSSDATSVGSTSGSNGNCPEAADTSVAGTDASFPEGKPEVEIPAALPTELVITDLIDGSGPEAKAGDVVTVNYVGVRSADGTEFDNSYDRGSTFPVTLGEGGVIAGWEQGLVGIKAGGRRQLDIPAELAYGDNPSGDIIQAGDALTFVIDAISVKAGPPVADPADAPKVDIPTSVGATEATVTDLVDGDPCQIASAGDSAYVQLILYRGDTGEELQSTWTSGQPVQISLDESTLPGLVDGIVGMGVGGRRLLILPPDLGFGADTNAQMGLDADTDIVLVVDLVQIG